MSGRGRHISREAREELSSGEAVSEIPSTLHQSSHGFATRAHGLATKTKALAHEIPPAIATPFSSPEAALLLVSTKKSRFFLVLTKRSAASGDENAATQVSEASGLPVLSNRCRASLETTKTKWRMCQQ